MLLSPPFLPARGALDEAAWLEAAMPPAADGAFPVSHNFGWHGGRHLAAPLDASGVGLPVRAIADGTVVYVRQRTDADAPDEPLNYGAGYTSDAVVVVRHTTDIGASTQGQPVTVTFYSVYMHLHSVRATVRLNRSIYRKDEIGQAGHIYGKANRLHFEICCDDTNLGSLVGRRAGELSTRTDGRSDVIFGDMYFTLPVGTAFYASRPLPQYAQAMTQPAAQPVRHGQPPAARSPTQALPVSHTSRAEFIVGLHHAGGAGPAGQRGDAVLTTYRPDGSVEGTPLPDHEAEYDLYARATAISEAYPAAGRPTPSAVYELLRFGRVMGPDTLAPADVPHWREVSYPGGRGWVDLNAAGVRKSSDADFPPWCGWVLVDDDTDGNSHCDSAALRKLIDPDAATRATPSRAQAAARLSEPAVQKKLARTIAKFPSEWDASTLDKRWGWLKTKSDDHPEPLTDEDYADFKAHAQALCFALPELFAAPWCFEPRTFVEVFRKCGWLSASEFKQLMPLEVLRKTKAGMVWEATATASVSGPIAVNQRVPLNRMMRKYLINASAQRMASFFGNALQETQWLGKLHEGNDAERYAPWDGRGFLQLTWPSNYLGYWDYRGWAGQIPQATRAALLRAEEKSNETRSNSELMRVSKSLPQSVVDLRDAIGDLEFETDDPSESAGYYWARLRMAAQADEPHVLERVPSGTGAPMRPYYRSPSFWRASASVNLPGAVNTLYSKSLNGFESRCVSYSQALAVLGEQTFISSGGAPLWFPEGLQKRRER